MAICMALVVGCSSVHSPQRVSLDESVSYQLQTVPSNWPIQSPLQLITITREDKQQSLLLQSELQGEQLNIVALTVQGMSVFSMSLFKDGSYTLEKHIPGLNLYPSHMLADMQLASWPIKSIKNGLEGAVLKNEKTRRVVADEKGQLIVISFSDNKTTLTHLRRHYTITIEEIN
jgi:hypothetical protein